MRFGVNIQKRFAFRGGVQHFGNTYYYESNTGGAQPAIGTLDALVQDIVTKEKARHSQQITFVRGRLWSQIGTQAQNQMLVDNNLSGTGSATHAPAVDRERAWLVRFEAGSDSKGRPVYLRKWWHLLAVVGGAGYTNGQTENMEELSQSHRDALVAFGNSIKEITVGSPAVVFSLVSKNGREITGGTQAHRFLEHRQLGDEWRQA